jgi:hypothetical protein
MAESGVSLLGLAARSELDGDPTQASTASP